MLSVVGWYTCRIAETKVVVQVLAAPMVKMLKIYWSIMAPVSKWASGLTHSRLLAAHSRRRQNFIEPVTMHIAEILLSKMLSNNQSRNL